MDQPQAILTAATMAILGILYTARQQRKAIRKQHTYGVLDKLNDWEKFDTNYDYARKLMKAGEVPSSRKTSGRESAERIEFLLNHYEFLSACIIRGDIDESLVRLVEEGRLTRVFLKFMPYVEEVRSDLNSKEIWENVEFICHRWAVEPRDPFDSALSGFLLRPSKATFDSNREEAWKALQQKAATQP